MGSVEAVSQLQGSRAIAHQVAIGKLDLTLIPANMTTNGQEDISQFLTTLWLYERVLRPAEWLLVFQTDSAYAYMPSLSAAFLWFVWLWRK